MKEVVSEAQALEEHVSTPASFVKELVSALLHLAGNSWRVKQRQVVVMKGLQAAI